MDHPANVDTALQPPKEGDVPYRITVEFGDCDPAGIVFFPNFFRWMDSASRHYFVQRGVPPWRDTERDWGVLGTPVVDVSARFIKPASYGDVLAITTELMEWRSKSFVQRHHVWCGATLLVVGTEVRVFAAHADDGGTAIRAVPIPPQIRALCGG